MIWKIWLSGFLFAIVHSLLATQACKDLGMRLGLSRRAYRLFYSVLAVAATMLWLGYVHGLPDAPLYAVHGAGRWVLVALQLAGLVLVVASFRTFNARAFLGLAAADEDWDPFHETGVYRWVRHPMYTGFMMLLLASPVQTFNSLNLALCICLYFLIGSRFEEKRMLRAHAEYADYRRRVPAFLPRWSMLVRRCRFLGVKCRG